MPLERLISIGNPDYIAGKESRGFITASVLAFKHGIGFIAIRKPNKLTSKVKGINYQLDYGENRIEMQGFFV